MAGVNRPLSRRTGPKFSTQEVISLVSSDVPTTFVVPTTYAVSVNQRSTAYLTLTSPYTVVSSGSSVSNGVVATLPRLSLAAYGGAQLASALPSLTLSASGTVPAVGRMSATLPALTLLASGQVGGLAVARLDLGSRYGLIAYGGAHARLSHAGRYALNASGFGGGLAVAELTLNGHYGLNANITAEAHAQAAMTLPSLQVAPSGKAWLVGPRLSLHAVGHEVVAISYEAYAINLTTGVVTHYTNYPFDNILRFGNKFYGVAATGLFEIGGDLDGAAQITAHIKTFSTKLGSDQMKRVPYLYISGRSDGGVTVGVTADEGETYEYDSTWGDVPGSTNHRTQIGKGIRGVYYSFDLSNIGGSSLDLDSITAEPAVSQRNI